MHVLISDYKEQMEADYSMTASAIKEFCPDVVIDVEPYGTEAFYEKLALADGMITAFLPVDEELLSKAKNLKVISQNAVGYSNVELEAVKSHKVALYHIEEYCTREVSEHAIALMMALNRNLKSYGYGIEKNREWLYQAVPARRTLNNLKLAIFGFGRIGKQTAALAKALGTAVMAVDPYVNEEDMSTLGVRKVTKEEALKQADIIINHMALTKDNTHFFDRQAFESMGGRPLFINVGRGGCVDEQALIEALDQGKVSAAALDVLEEENPDLTSCPFIGRDNVILTPHSAFYSLDSIEKLHQISGANLGSYLAGQEEKATGLIYRPENEKHLAKVGGRRV